MPGKFFAVAATPPPCSPSANGTAVAATRGRGRAEAAVGVGDVAPGPGDVEHRREVDVDADVAQVQRGAPALRAAEGGAPFPITRAEALGAPPIRFTSPPSWSIITSSGSRNPGGRGIAWRSRDQPRPAPRLGRLPV